MEAGISPGSLALEFHQRPPPSQHLGSGGGSHLVPLAVQAWVRGGSETPLVLSSLGVRKCQGWVIHFLFREAGGQEVGNDLAKVPLKIGVFLL